MTLICFACLSEENADHPLAVCHHCGRPVCREHRVWLSDPVFSDLGRDWERAAHCTGCHMARHPKLVAQTEPAPSAAAPPLP